MRTEKVEKITTGDTMSEDRADEEDGGLRLSTRYCMKGEMIRKVERSRKVEDQTRVEGRRWNRTRGR